MAVVSRALRKHHLLPTFVSAIGVREVLDHEFAHLELMLDIQNESSMDRNMLRRFNVSHSGDEWVL
jgi:hypothetical protein